MATADSVKAKIQNLIASANAVTGESSSDMSDAVAKLIAGFGSTGDSGNTGTSSGQAKVHMGTFVAPERSENNIEFPIPGDITFFILFMNGIADTTTGSAYVTALVANKEVEYVYTAGSNSSGTLSSAAYGYPAGEPTANNYPGIKFEEDKVTYIPFKPFVSYCRMPQPGRTYIWIAW